jgi:hypothetical protein
MSRTEIEEAKAAVLLAEIKRRDKLNAWNDYTSFFATKLVGLASLLSGTISSISPDTLPLHLQPGQSRMLIGLGLGLLIGNRVVGIVAKIVNALK